MRRVVAGRVSVVVVNYRGLDDTSECLEALSSVDWPDVEIIVVDNASGDGSAETLAARFPEVRLVALDVNLGFAGGCNRGVREATGEYVALLNNDAKPGARWLAPAIDALESDRSIGCVASKVLDWDGQAIDFVQSALSFYGHGFKLHVGEPDLRAFDANSDVLFASGTAMVMPTAVFRAAGGFDERYFMFFEDVDLGWRLWLQGHRVRYVADSIVYHRHHRSMRGRAPWFEQYLLERNALFTIFKNYDDANLARVFPAALLLTARRGFAVGDVDTRAIDLASGVRDEDEDSIAMPKSTLAGLFAIDAVVEELSGLVRTRHEIQSSRRRGDQEIVRMFRLPFQINMDAPGLVDAFEPVVSAFGVRDVFSPRQRILVATGDTLAPQMAGPAIRAWEIARALAREHEVQLVSTVDCHDLSHPDFAVRLVDERELQELVRWCDLLIFQGFLMRQHPCLRATEKVVVVDIYDPFHLEQLEQARDLGPERRRREVQAATEVLNEQLARGDVFLCASDKQRSFWLGQLSAVGRVNPATYDADERMDSLVKVVPFGVSDEVPRHTRDVLRGVVPGIGPDDKIVLWGGGIYNWFDPLTLLRAVDKLRARLPEVRLYFLGLGHPNPNVPTMRMALGAQALSAELGLTGIHAFFNQGWVAYEDRQNYLLEADLGVSTHLEHVEAEFSFRTRILDYLWASLPVVATAGDSFGDLIELERFGLAVPPGDVDALEDALFRLLTDEDLRAECVSRAASVAESYRWSRVLQPVLDFCREPRRAPDLLDPDVAAQIGAIVRFTPRWRQDVSTALRLVRSGELRTLAGKAVRRVRGTRGPAGSG